MIVEKYITAKRVRIVRRHFDTLRHIGTVSLLCSITLARRVILGTVCHFCTEGHFTTASFKHGPSLWHSPSFLHSVTLALQHRASFLHGVYLLPIVIFAPFFFPLFLLKAYFFTVCYFGQINNNFKPSYEKFLIVYF